jgi:hypothetical protein
MEGNQEPDVEMIPVMIGIAVMEVMYCVSIIMGMTLSITPPTATNTILNVSGLHLTTSLYKVFMSEEHYTPTRTARGEEITVVTI